ncbi:esterase FE4 [Aphidius gifuensis]|uniref:esterase FE4 n=1 Tax=Aphidius gifuensis TaxID=684658 RepID=UPI001CDD1FAF|nr:esterase FE4 [Aphidius gifuensis]
MQLISLILFFLLGTINADEEGEIIQPEIEISLGKIKGSIIQSRLKKKIFSFRGLRYAEPPFGQQRFQQAIPAKKWNDTFDASEEGPSCPQPGGKYQSEDCLRLNVYSTKLSTKNDIVKRPVIVFFHPGGFYGSSGQSFIEGPQYFMDQDIVLVTVNYRLASLGFFSTGDSLAPGNLGLKDQVAALRWIKLNIENFGGDSNCVTIMGYSAGGWSVSLHLVSPMSKDLFHRAIVMSGSATYQNSLPNDQKNLAKKQAELLGCPTDTTGNMLICLNTKTTEEFVNTTKEFFEWHGDPILVWMPVVEPEVPGVERFLTGQPADLIRAGKFHQVPLIAGVTEDEFGGVVVSVIEDAEKGDDSIFQDLNANWSTIAPISFLYERDTQRSLSISEELWKYYMKNKPIGPDNYQGLADLYADGVVGFSVHRLVTLMSQASKEPVYYYKFSYKGQESHVKWANNTPYGVVHHDDLLYFFNVSYFNYFDENSVETPIVERMTTMWTNFAKTGIPLPKDNKLNSNIEWIKYNQKKPAYLNIGNELEIIMTGINTERMNEWDKLFPLKSLPGSA